MIFVNVLFKEDIICSSLDSWSNMVLSELHFKWLVRVLFTCHQISCLSFIVISSILDKWWCRIWSMFYVKEFCSVLCFKEQMWFEILNILWRPKVYKNAFYILKRKLTFEISNIIICVVGRDFFKRLDKTLWNIVYNIVVTMCFSCIYVFRHFA